MTTAHTAAKRGRSSSSSSNSTRSGHGKAPHTHKGQGKPVAAFLFRRDFRLYDNTALLKLCAAASQASMPVLPLFFFNPIQCDKAKNPYFGDHCFRFMCESLTHLDQSQLDGRLVCLRGSDEQCLRQIHKSGLDVAMIGFNADITPFALVRDERLEKHCESHGIACVADSTDFTLLPLDAVLNGAGHPYSVFGAFAGRVLGDLARDIRPVNRTKLDVAETFFASGKKHLGDYCVDPAALAPRLAVAGEHGGRDYGLARVKGIADLKHYDTERNYVALDQTSHLSPHLKFGTVSIREVWERTLDVLGLNSSFARQLTWREFYYHTIYHHPRLVQGQLNVFAEGKGGTKLNQPFQAKYEAFKWNWEPAHYDAFRAGQTGVPLVDAAVRCVTATGWCHNRNRLVLAGFLVKSLGVDWREGERWYATVGVDYDVANNSGGWLWTSGQGADAQPFFRSFNPFRQSERFDADCEFIKKWVPELRDVPPEMIHKWDVCCAKYRKDTKAAGASTKVNTRKLTNKAAREMDIMSRVKYPSPIVDTKARTKAVSDSYKKYNESL